MHISTAFDSGNITVLSATDPSHIRLEITPDRQSDFYQWFHFRLTSRAGQEHIMVIENAGGAAYPDGWENYHALASYDRDTWFRVPTQYNGQHLTITHTPEQETVYYAYFVPYSHERHLDLLQWAQQSAWVQQELLGTTLDGRELNVLRVGEPDTASRTVWITARQHPGETMAEWFIEGLLEQLLAEDEPVSRQLLAQCVFYIVPNMNPDGSVRGHLRTNAAGVNLNREWDKPSLERSPEVYHTVQKMQETGVDLFLDIHGDEAIPYNFLAGCEGIPAYDDRHAELEQAFRTALLRATPEFQVAHGYTKDAPGEANLTLGTTATGQRFQCLAFTLEMPFKDNDDLPDPLFGWSDTRSRQLGRDTLTAIHAVADKLR